MVKLTGHSHLKVKLFSQIDNCTYFTNSKNENDILNGSLIIKDNCFVISNTDECRNIAVGHWVTCLRKADFSCMCMIRGESGIFLF